MNKNIIKIFLALILSIFIGVFNLEIIFNDNKTMFQILLSVLGLCLTAYTFVLIPIQNIVKENKATENLISKLLKEYKDNMLFIFTTCILLIIIDLTFKVNFPLISNPKNIDFGLFKIYSLKSFLKFVLEDFLCILSLYSFFDIMQSIFILVNNSTINKH